MAAGLFYGVVIFAVMNYAVVPLSAVGHTFSFTPVQFLENMLAMLLFGIIIAYAAREPQC
jgi:FtsH-binding integral membrane protein